MHDSDYSDLERRLRSLEQVAAQIPARFFTGGSGAEVPLAYVTGILTPGGMYTARLAGPPQSTDPVPTSSPILMPSAIASITDTEIVLVNEWELGQSTHAMLNIEYPVSCCPTGLTADTGKLVYKCWALGRGADYQSLTMYRGRIVWDWPRIRPG